jgi:hypothetical protein
MVEWIRSSQDFYYFSLLVLADKRNKAWHNATFRQELADSAIVSVRGDFSITPVFL